VPDFTIRVGEALRHAALDPFAQTSLAQYEDQTFRLLERFRPAPAFWDTDAKRFGFFERRGLRGEWQLNSERIRSVEAIQSAGHDAIAVASHSSTNSGRRSVNHARNSSTYGAQAGDRAATLTILANPMERWTFSV